MHEKKGDAFDNISKSFLIYSFRRTNGTSDGVVFELAVLREETDSKNLALRIFCTVWTCAPKTLLKEDCYGIS